MGAEPGIWCLPESFSSLVFETGSEPGHLGVDQQAMGNLLPCFPSAGITGVPLHLAFYVGSGIRCRVLTLGK